MARTKGTKTLIGISLDTGLVKRIDELAAVQSYSRSKMIELLLAESLKGQEMTVRAFTNPTILRAFGSAFGDPVVLRALAQAAGDELRADQLELFKHALQDVAEQMDKPPATEKPEKPGKPVKRKSRGKR